MDINNDEVVRFSKKDHARIDITHGDAIVVSIQIDNPDVDRHHKYSLTLDGLEDGSREEYPNSG